ncbi:adenosylcobalamin-dependent ribonucleoside-diphosphate reductase [Anaeroselena agilis]|uniref:Vitamin B12-dependent ribonucleotide reductase n=1 Tax=Anaeroselena agilis TaxID=3063788 RepID=A0ABU3NWE1_9FIRM|nr:adenosylcobalamin-dependent ribonucleoside-diphosphate reductase [Selenomonadales bacterium 4137-cl]
MFSSEAEAVLQARYLKDGETPADMFRRVAGHVAQAETRNGRDSFRAADEYRRLMDDLVFLPNSPTLINAGKARAQLAACFVLPVDDSLTSIFETLKNAALIHQSGGGTGFSFSRLRPACDRVSTTGGEASGPVSFMHIYDVATQVVKQGAARRGANMAVLRVDHPDIEQFITAKRSHDVLNNFNLSVAITDDFMQAVAAGRPYALVNPRNGGVVKTVAARGLFSLLVRMAWESGEPGLFFLDTVNRYNPTPGLGAFEAPNPCSEQPLLPYESCVLGSINLTRLVAGGDIDFGRLRQVVHTAVSFLDNVIDINDYPLPAVAEATRRTRKIGLGIMGLAEVFIMLDIPYASEAAVKLTGRILEFITGEARQASALLGAERGSFPAFAASVYPGRGFAAMRNATVTTIAPTGTISIIAGCSSGIEPLFALALSRRVLEGRVLTSVNRTVVDYLSQRNLYTEEIAETIATCGSVADTALPARIKEVLATAREIAPYWHVAHLAAAQMFTDNGVSKTVNMPHEASEADVAAIFRQAYAGGCKGVTVYRDGSRAEQVLTGGTVCEECSL